MKRFKHLLAGAIVASGIIGLAVPAMAGEITGNGNKEDFSQGSSICKFSGLNDLPAGDPDEGPAGRTQNYGHDGDDLWADPDSLEPHGGFQMHPGWLCKPPNLDVSGR